MPAVSSSWSRIYHVVRRIPAGRVATYGQVADIAGLRGQARLVGYALHALAGDDAVPWHRVLNAAGRISIRGLSAASVTQRLRLEQEGVRFDARGRVRLEQFQWKPRRSATGRSTVKVEHHGKGRRI